MRMAFGRMARAGFRVAGLALMVAAIAGTASAKGPIGSAPEIDPGSMGSALTLLIGGAFWLTGKGRKS